MFKNNTIEGVYTLKPESCFKFEKEEYKYDTAAASTVDLKVTHYLLKGLIDVTLDTAASQPNIQVAIT
jgi:hypothetical protein